jgi:hypothetical protein
MNVSGSSIVRSVRCATHLVKFSTLLPDGKRGQCPEFTKGAPPTSFCRRTSSRYWCPNSWCELEAAVFDGHMNEGGSGRCLGIAHILRRSMVSAAFVSALAASIAVQTTEDIRPEDRVLWAGAEIRLPASTVLNSRAKFTAVRLSRAPVMTDESGFPRRCTRLLFPAKSRCLRKRS